MLEKFFSLSENKTTVKTEIIAGITTFMTMAYILAVNPDILSQTGMDKQAVFIEGIIFLLLTTFNIRELIVNSIPMNMKHAISAGIGLFIAFIGLHNSGLIVDNPATLVGLGKISNPTVIITMFGLILSGVLMALKIKGALLIGIFATTALGIPMGVTHLPEGNLISTPPSIAPIAFQFDFSEIFSMKMLVVLFTFLFVDMFDTVGTLVGVASKANILDQEGKLPRVKQALFADAIGTTVGAALGTSTVTTYIESASGVAEGGRTGLTSLTVAGMFILSLFLSPLFLMVPAAATAPILILIGSFMLSPIVKVDFSDTTESIPVFLTIIMMPLTYSIAEGIVFGMLSYVILKLLSGKHKEISIVSYIIALFFILKFFMK